MCVCARVVSFASTFSFLAGEQSKRSWETRPVPAATCTTPNVDHTPLTRQISVKIGKLRGRAERSSSLLRLLHLKAC